MSKFGIPLLAVLSLVGCSPTEDAGPADAMSDRRLHDTSTAGDFVDADQRVDAGEAGPIKCSGSEIGIGLSDPNDPNRGCKFEVHWTCGKTAYRSGGGCDSFDGGQFQGLCQKGDASVLTFKEPGAPCTCDDPDAMAERVREHCPSP